MFAPDMQGTYNVVT